MDFTPVFRALEQCGTTIPDLIIALLTEARFKKTPLTAELLDHGDIIYTILKHKKVPGEAQQHAGKALHLVYAAEIEDLVDVKSEWHFSALRAVPQDLDGFHIEQLAADIDVKAPMLSALFEVLLSARKQSKWYISRSRGSSAASEIPADHDGNKVRLEGEVRTSSSPEEQAMQKIKQKEKIIMIVRLTGL